MRKSVVIIGVLPLLACTALFVYRAGVILNQWSPMRRPGGVTPAARYVFSWESAGWFDCSVDAHRNVNVCLAWDDQGRLLAWGDFQLEKERRAAVESELQPLTVGPVDRDGRSRVIYLNSFGGERRQLVNVPRGTAKEMHQ